nr:transposase [uncultured Cohaesibacter sp.]
MDRGTGKIQNKSDPSNPGTKQQRNAVERFFNKIKQFRAIATRYDKNPLNFLAAIKLVAALVWIRSL